MMILQRIRIILPVLIVVLTFILYLGGTYLQRAITGPPRIKHLNEGEVGGKPLPPLHFSLQNQYGEISTERIFQNKISVVNFFYATCPTICPRMNSHLAQVYHSFKGDQRVQFLSFTVDPEHDSVAVLREYAQRFQVDTPQWLFLTGNKVQIYTLAIDYLKLFAMEPSSAKREFIHSEQAVLIDPKGYIRGYYNATKEEDIQRLKKDIEWLLSHTQ